MKIKITQLIKIAIKLLSADLQDPFLFSRGDPPPFMTDLTDFPIFSASKGHHRGLTATLRLARGVEVQPVTWLVEDGKNRRRKSRAKEQHH